MAILTEAGVDISNQYSAMRIPEINDLGTEALKECVTLELQERGLWQDPEVRWALDFSLDKHSGEERKDGPYVNHILRAGIWAIREFDTCNPEIAKVVFMHDVVENQAKAVVEELDGNAIRHQDLIDGALKALRASGKLSNHGTIEAIELITCPPFAGSSVHRRIDYAGHIVGKTLGQPLAAVAKLADQIENFNGNAYNPDLKLRQRLDLKYYPLHEAFKRAVYAEGSLVPSQRRAFVKDVLVDGRDRAKLRLLQDGHDPKNIAALTLPNVLSGNLPI